MKYKPRFCVTQEIVTPESAEHGKSDSCDLLDENLSLRDAVKLLHATRTAHVGGVESIEADESPIHRPRWITVINSMEYRNRPRWITVINPMEYRTGAHESRSLHIPESVTPASRRRIARLCRVHP